MDESYTALKYELDHGDYPLNDQEAADAIKAKKVRLRYLPLKLIKAVLDIRGKWDDVLAAAEVTEGSGGLFGFFSTPGVPAHPVARKLLQYYADPRFEELDLLDETYQGLIAAAVTIPNLTQDDIDAVLSVADVPWYTTVGFKDVTAADVAYVRYDPVLGDTVTFDLTIRVARVTQEVAGRVSISAEVASCIPNLIQPGSRVVLPITNLPPGTTYPPGTLLRFNGTLETIVPE